MNHKKVTLICADEASGLSTAAIRSALEYFGFIVSTHWIGNKKQFLDLLRGNEHTDDLIVISAHGTDGRFFMPNDESIKFGELKINLPHKIVISTGCETHSAQKVFLVGKCDVFIAPSGSPEGNDANFFVTKFFWLLAQGKKVQDAFKLSAEDMPKGSEFIMKTSLK